MYPLPVSYEVETEGEDEGVGFWLTWFTSARSRQLFATSQRIDRRISDAPDIFNRLKICPEPSIYLRAEISWPRITHAWENV